MKIYVKSSSDIQDRFADIDTTAYNCGYNLEVNETSDGVPSLTLTCTDEDVSHMPELYVETVETKGSYLFNVTAKFPDLVLDESEYQDSAEYYLGKWSQVGRLITKIRKTDYNPNMYED